MDSTLEAAFRQFDADGNGTLDKAEATALTRTIAESGTVDLATAERLMEQAMNPGGKAGMEQSAMDFDAFFEGYVRVSGKTLMHITASRSIELHTAIRDGSLDAVEELFASGAVHCSLPLYTDGVPNAQGVLPLHRAARHGHLDIVRFLLRQVREGERALGLAHHDGRVRRLGLVFLRTLRAIGVAVAKRSHSLARPSRLEGSGGAPRGVPRGLLTVPMQAQSRAAIAVWHWVGRGR